MKGKPQRRMLKEQQRREEEKAVRKAERQTKLQSAKTKTGAADALDDVLTKGTSKRAAGNDPDLKHNNPLNDDGDSGDERE